MKRRTHPRKSCRSLRGWFLILLSVLALAGSLVGPQTVFAADTGPTVEGSICMQRVFMGPPNATVTNANKLNCTANDIRISRAISVTPSSCFSGTTFDLTGTFEVIVTANARYDAGFFFRVDGGADARGTGATAAGTCSLSTLTNGVGPSLNLDGDTCGDLNAGTYQVTFTIPGVVCNGVTDPNDPTKKILKLPNCTSWHSNQGTACTTPTSGDNTSNSSHVYDLHPDTKSKCVCDDNFTVPVVVEDITLGVVKTASPTSVPEPGGTVTYTVQITNNANATSVTITSINDNVYGDLGSATNPNVTDNTCPSKINTVLAPGGSTSCSFKGSVSGNAGASVTDTVEVCGNGSGGQQNICGDDDAIVDITDVFTAPSLTKTAQSSTVSCTVDVTYQVVVSNNSTIDTLTLTALNDDKFGVITSTHAAGTSANAFCNSLATCEQVVSTTCGQGGAGNPGTLPAQIATSGNYTCSFVGRISSSDCSVNHTDTVTANVTDDDGHSSTPSDDATVTVSVTKSP